MARAADNSPPARSDLLAFLTGARLPLLLACGWSALALCARIHSLESSPALLRCGNSGACQSLLLAPRLKLLGFPPADWGLAFFVLFLLSLLVASLRRIARPFVFHLVLWIGLFAAFGSLFAQLFVFHAWCPYCLSLDGILIVAAAAGLPPHPLAAEPRDLLLAVLLGLQSLVFIAFLSKEGPDGPAGPSQVVAIIRGQPIMAGPMEDDLALGLQPLDEERYALEKEWVDKELNRKALAFEADAKGLSPEQLLTRQLGVAPSSDDPAWKQKKAAYLAQLRGKYDAVVYLKPPEAKLVHFNQQDLLFVGKPDAPVQVVIFSDHDCPFCKLMEPVLSDFYRAHAQDVALGYWPYPLKGHKNALPAAIAAYSAAQQGHFAEYNALLYSVPMLSDGDYLAFARKLHLDLAAFTACQLSAVAGKFVQDHAQRATDMGIDGIPTIFFNGRMIGGMVTAEDLEKLYQSSHSGAEAR